MLSAADADAAPRGKVLPPRALLLSLLAQTPLVLWHWPLSPRVAELACGAAMLIAGIALNIWADALFRRDGVGVRPFSAVPRLIVDGPYRYTRNPMYVGLVLIAVGVTFVTGVLANLCAPALYAIWLHARFVLPEEAFLRSRIGEPFDAYTESVPRWLGFPALPRHEERDSSRANASTPATSEATQGQNK